MSESPRRGCLVFAAGLAAWCTNAAIAWMQAAPLGHDEAQYAIAARDCMAGAHERWLYVSRGMDAIAAPGVLLGGGERALRALPALIGIAFVCAVWRLARRVTDERSAAWTAAVLAGSHAFAKRAVELLSDLPAATCLVLALIVIVGELSREAGPRWRLVLAAPCAAGAIYVRYGSVVPLAVLAVAAAIAGWRAWWRRPAPVVVTLVAFGVLLVPHLAAARSATGSPLGILIASSQIPGQEPGLFDYIATNPFTYYGLAIAPALAAGVCSIAWRHDRVRVLLWMIAIGDVVGVGLVTNAQSRYIFFGLALLAILGIELLREAIGERWLAAIAVVAVAAELVAASCYGKHLRAHFAETLSAARAIRADAHGADCVAIGPHMTQLEWYSGCVAVFEPPPGARTYAWHAAAQVGIEPALDDLPGRHVVLREHPLVVRIER